MIKIRTVIEIAGFPKEHIEQTMQKVVTTLRQDKEVVVLNVSVAETQQIKTMWSTFCEFELQFSNEQQLLTFCYDYTPSYIEIIEPLEIVMSSTDFGGFMNDFLGKLHQYNAVITNVNAENMVLKDRLENINKKPQETNKDKRGKHKKPKK